MIHQVFTSFGQKEPSINSVLGCKAPDDDDGGQVGAVGSHQYCRSSQPESQWSVRERRPAMPGQFITTAKIMNPSKAELPQKGVMGCKALRGWQKENGTPDYKRLNVCFSFRRFRPDTVLEGIRPPARSRSHAGGLSILLGPRPGRSTSTHGTYCKYLSYHDYDIISWWCWWAKKAENMLQVLSADDASAVVNFHTFLSVWFIPPSFLPAVDARGVACAALQGTPFSSTHSSSTADLKRLQSLGEEAFSQIKSLSHQTKNSHSYSWFQVSR